MITHLTIDLRMIEASGIGTYIQALCPRLIDWHRDCEFVLLGDPQKLKGYAWTGYEHVRVIPALQGIYSLREQVTLTRLIPSDTDLFWVPHYNVPMGYRGALVVNVHDVIPLALPHLLQGYHKRLFARLLFRTIRQRAKCVLTGSRFSAEEISRLANIAPSRIATIRNGIDSNAFGAEVNATGIHPKPFILYVGNVKPHKNVGGCIAAFERIADHIQHDLVIVGKRDGFVTGDHSLEKGLGRLGKRVVFTGHVSDERLRQYFRGADVFLFPSLYEGFGLPPLEAMASGTPCLVSHAASLPEVCGAAPVYCDPTSIDDIASKLKSLLEDEGLRQLCRERGLKHVRSFNWDESARQTWEVLTQACDGLAADRAKNIPPHLGRTFHVTNR